MNNFIFPHQNDPLLADETLKQLDAYRQALLALKEKLSSQSKPITEDNAWDNTEKELAMLTEEQKHTLMSDDAFIESNDSVLAYLHILLNSLLKPEMLKSDEGNKLLSDRLDVVKSLKKKVIKDTTKLLEQFKEYTEKYSDISWEEYLKTKAK